MSRIPPAPRAAPPSLFAPEDLPERPEAWETAAERDRLVAQVVLPLPLDTVYSYWVPDEFRGLLGPGQRVQVRFGKGDRNAVGFCVAVDPLAALLEPAALAEPDGGRSGEQVDSAARPPRREPLPVGRMKSIAAVLDREPLVSREMLDLTQWIADRYLCGWGQVLDSVVPGGVKRQAGTRIVQSFRPAPDVCAKRDDLDLPLKQRAVLDVLCAAGEPLAADVLAERAGCGTGPLTALRRKGLIQALRRRTSVEAPDSNAEAAPRTESDLTLGSDQRAALDAILKGLRSGAHRTFLLHGVTGSGKTEVYIQAIREVVSYGKQAIVLVPEISLTPQTIRRFRSRFESVAVLHSHLSDADRHWHWQEIARGAVQVVVGARSAVFAPVPRLGLIVIDEEHETTFKQDTVPRYHARETARRRAEAERIPLILGSATPSLESWARVAAKRDVLLSLPRRVEGRRMPPVVLLDVRDDPHVSRGGAIGRQLDVAVRATLRSGAQVILFQNLRGYSPTLWCRHCRAPLKCPQCDVSLTWHRDKLLLLCHVCEHEEPQPNRCPACGKPGLRYLGVGTQKLEEEVRSSYPDAVCLRMDGDTMRGAGSHDRALESFRKGEAQILLGTQMIAKGLDFPDVTLVGVIDADVMLHQPDLRASERTFQLLAQVAGRTGRGPRGGRVLVQTACPDEPAIRFAAAHDFLGFARYELQHRREMGAPPFRHLVRLVFRGPHEEAVRRTAKETAALLVETAKTLALDVRLLGPAPCPVSRLQGRFRFHVQMSSPDLAPLRTLWRTAQPHLPAASDVEHVIDVDPLNLR